MSAPLKPDVEEALARSEERISELESILRLIAETGGAWSRTAKAALERAGR